nr:MAG TPA: hypothetical protein [Caudoviricetes sp.]
MMRYAQYFNSVISRLITWPGYSNKVRSKT